MICCNNQQFTYGVDALLYQGHVLIKSHGKTDAETVTEYITCEAHDAQWCLKINQRVIR